MARKPQKLINFNTSGSALPQINQVEHGEIVVRWKTEDPELLIKIDDSNVDDGERFATFIDSAHVHTAITGASSDITQKINTLSATVESISGKVETLSGWVETSAATHEEVGSASANAITSAKAYTDTLSGDVVTWAEETFLTQVSATSKFGTIDQAITDVSGQVESLSSKVESDYALKSDVHTWDGQMSAAAVNSAASYVDYASGQIETFVTEHYVESAIVHSMKETLTSLNNNFTTVSGHVETLSGSVHNMSADVKSYIDDRIGTVYKVKGSVTNYNDLAGISEKENGDVYNVVNAHGNPGDSGYTPAGTNYVWVESAYGPEGGHWDPMGGTVDLSAYAKQDDLSALSSTTETIESSLAAVSGNLVTGLSATVVADYATSANTYNAITAATNNLNTLSGSVTAFSATVVSGYVTSADTYGAISGVSERVSTIETNLPQLSGSVSALSASTVAIEGKVGTAVQDITTGQVSGDSTSGDTYASGVKISEDAETHNVTFDFSELIIDCGTF